MEEPTDLTRDQRRRADALVIAGRLLGTRGPLAASTLPEHRTPEDVVDLANYILDGTHPLAEYRDRTGDPLMEYPKRLVPVSTPGENPGDDD